VRAWAAYALLRITGERKRYLPQLLGMVGATSEVGEALRLLGPAAREVLPELLAALKSPRPAVREGAIGCLGCLGPAAARAVPALVRLLGDKDFRTRCQAAEALGNIGPSAKAAIPRLEALAEENDQAARQAEWALEKIRLPHSP
jgi:HEAT repeat protein